MLTNAELKAYILKITDQWFGLTSVQIAVAVLVAILGIVNTLTVSITDRRRELGVLQAVGGLRGQIRRTIWIEALSIGVLGLVLGFGLGAINLYYILQIIHQDIAGMRLDVPVPRDGGRRRSCRRFSRRRSSRPSGRRSRRCTVRSWRRWSMSKRSPSHEDARCVLFFVSFVFFVPSRYAGLQVGSPPLKLPARLSRKPRSGPTRSRSATRGCSRCSTRRERSATSAGTSIGWASHGDSKAVLRFTAPAEVKGVALLVVNHPDRASDQWMWTPAIERDRRIALQDRSTRFFGTDFSFEDLEERDVNQYEYALLGDETLDGVAVLEDPVDAEGSQVVAVHAIARLDPEGQLRVRAHRELPQGPGRPPARVFGHREHPGNLDRADRSR